MDQDEAWFRFTDGEYYHRLRAIMMGAGMGEGDTENAIAIIWENGYMHGKDSCSQLRPNIGHEVIDAIVSDGLCAARCAEDHSHGCVIVWSSGASEQVEAAISRCRESSE